MVNNNEKEEQVIETQLITLFFSLLSVIVSILLTYNQKLEISNKKTLFSTKKTFKITKYNRILIFIVSITFLYINYRLYEISKKEGEDLKPYQLQILASIFTVIASLITLYVVSLSTKDEVVDIENPIV